MSARCLVDSNVLLYANDIVAGDKWQRAELVLKELVSGVGAFVTSQVVTEFYKNAIAPRGREPLLSPLDAIDWIDAWIQNADWLEITADVVREALRGAVQYQVNIYDAQMWAVARVYGVPVLVTEDFQSPPTIEGVRYINPFDDAFDLADLGL